MSPQQPPVLQVTGLHFAYPERILFTDLSACVSPGVTLVRGGDGRGKSTLLRLLAGQLAADAGQLLIHGQSLQTQAQAYLRQVFWTEPRSEDFDSVSAQAYFASRRDLYPAMDAQLLNRLVEGLALGPQLDKPLFMLSTGSKRKVWMAAALASGAALVLLDQPFAALDKASIDVLKQCLDAGPQASHSAWVIADHQAPDGVRLAGVIDLGD